MESKGAISSTFPEKRVRMNGQILCYLVCFDFRLDSKLDIPSSVKSQINLIEGERKKSAQPFFRLEAIS